MGSRSRGDGNYRNPCITMHQPWASLLVYGIKRVEGRSWPSPIKGRYRLWIHAAGKVPDAATIKAMEDFYREIFAIDGVTDLKFPEHYPVSRLIGCVDVIGCLTSEELNSWEDVPRGVRLEGLTNFCWLCEKPQKLMVPFEMRGYQGVYNLENRIHDAAVGGLRVVKPPLTIKFPIPDPQDPFSLKPGSLVSRPTRSTRSEPEKTHKLAAVIAGAQTASTQFSRKNNNQSTPIQRDNDSSTQFLRKNTDQYTPIQRSQDSSKLYSERYIVKSTPKESNSMPVSSITRIRFSEQNPGFSSNSTQRNQAQAWVRKV